MENQIEKFKYKELETSFKRMRSAYSTIIRCQDIIVTAESEMEIYEEICKILVEEGPYKLAWIGFVESGPQKRVVPIAQAGFKKGYLSSINISWGDNVYGQGPTGRAVCECREQIVKDITIDTRYLPWREKAEKYGFRSTLAMPIECGGVVTGVLNIYSEHIDAFNTEEIELFQRLAKNIAQGIYLLKLKKESEASQRTHYEILLKTIDAFVLAIEKRDPRRRPSIWFLLSPSPSPMATARSRVFVLGPSSMI